MFRILSNLTTPVECLLPIDVMSKTDAGRNTILELRWLLESCKETFLDPRTTRCVVNHIKEVVSKVHYSNFLFHNYKLICYLMQFIYPNIFALMKPFIRNLFFLIIVFIIFLLYRVKIGPVQTLKRLMIV